MVNPLYVLVALFALLTSSVTLLRTRAVLRFRATGRVEPGSIPDWEVWAWRAMAGAVVLMTVSFLAAVVG